MKRLLIVLIGLCYFAAGAGFTLRQHYCMGDLIGTAIEHPAQHADSHLCAKCGMEKKNDDNSCCKDKVKIFKSTPDQVLAKAVYMPSFAASLLPPAFILPKPERVASLRRSPAAPAHGPPGKALSLPLYLQVRCLRL